MIFDRIESDRYTNIYRYFKTSLILIFTVVLYLPLISVPLTAAEQPEGDFQTVKTFHDIVFLTIAGTINPVSSRYVIREIRKAGEVSSLVVLQLDTPGGLESSTGDINRAILNSPVPVITYVSPRGARAASAGAFIMMASHITVMAPGTTMGAAHPVGLGGGMFGKQSNNTEAIMNDKITNILVSTMRTLAETHGRNTEVAATMVSESKSFTEKQALEAGLIDFIAGDVKELLRGLEGHPVQLQGKLFYISLSGTSKGRPVIMNYREELLNYLANPTVALIFMMLGIYGLIYEFTTPGFGFAGATGIFCLILAFFGLQNFPISVAGVALILLGAALLILEVKVISYGFLTLGGVGSIITGSMMLIDSKDATMQVSIRVLLGLATVLTVVFLLLLSVIIKAYRKKPRLGPASLIGLTGEVRELLCPEGGLVFVRGELWKAQLTGGGKAKRGTPIRIDKVRGNLVIVSTVEEG